MAGFSQTGLENFQWYFITKIPNFHGNSECHKTEKHGIQQVTYGLLKNLFVVLRNLIKVHLRDLLINTCMSVNNTYIYPYSSISIFRLSCCPCPILWGWQHQNVDQCLFQNSITFPWVTAPKFHDFSILINFKNFLWNSMTFTWYWNRFEFQWFFQSWRSSYQLFCQQ